MSGKALVNRHRQGSNHCPLVVRRRDNPSTRTVNLFGGQVVLPEERQGGIDKRLASLVCAGPYRSGKWPPVGFDSREC